MRGGVRLRFAMLLLIGLLGSCSRILPAADAAMTPRRAFAAAVIDDWVYVVGGWNGDATQLGLVEVRNPHNGQWHRLADLNVPRSQHALIAANNQLWAVAGWSADSGLVSAIERMSLCNPALPTPCSSWQIVSHLPTPRREPGVALFASQIVVAGGFDGSSDADLDGYSDRVESYDLESGRWRRLAALQIARRGLSLVAVEDQLFAIGGYTPSGFTNVVERYDAIHDRWQIVDWALLPRTWTASAVVEGDILLAGGYNADGFLNWIERINPQTGQLCHPPPLQIARSWFALAPTSHAILALGGETSAGFTGAVETVTASCQSLS